MANQTYDAIYKKFFGQPAMVEGLLRNLVPASFADEIDFSSLRRVSPEHIGPKYRKKQNDVIWQVDLRGSPCYIIIMLEFQRKNDHWMALRYLSYISLFWEDLIRDGSIKAGQTLPPIFPVVIYNGVKPWSAPRDMASLLPPYPPFLADYKPALKYFLIDEMRIPDQELKERNDPASLFFLLQRSKLPEFEKEFLRLQKILKFLKQPELERLFAEWLGYAFYDVGITQNIEKFKSLEDVNMGLLENARNWKYEYIAQGEKKGRAEGFAAGIAEGLTQGRAEGLTQGIAKGLTQGRAEGFAEGLSLQKTTLLEMLSNRFGEIPPDWADAIKAMTNQPVISELTISMLSVKSPEEFEKLLRQRQYN